MKNIILFLLYAFSTVATAQTRVECTIMKTTSENPEPVIYILITNKTERGDVLYMGSGFSSTSQRSLSQTPATRNLRPVSRYRREHFISEKDSPISLPKYFRIHPEAYNSYVAQRNQIVAATARHILR